MRIYFRRTNKIKLLLKSAVKLLGKLGLTHKFFSSGIIIAGFLLPGEKEIEVGKYKMKINPNEDLGLYFGYEDAEPGIGPLLRRELENGNVFVDVGAYKGYYSLIASELVGVKGKIIAFEPNPQSFEMLLNNLELNDISNIIAENAALSDFEGESRFMMSKMGSHFDSDSQTVVNVKTLDTVMTSLSLIPDMIKIDVEGAEYSVLKGGMDILTYHPKLLIEIHSNADFTLFDSLISLDYNIGLVGDEGEVEYINLEEIKKRCEDRCSNRYGTRINRHIYCEV